MMRSISLKMALALGVAISADASAQTSNGPPAVTPSDFTFGANISVVSQYRTRGLMQTNNKPAIQGGFDLTHSSGFYLRNWNSSISWLNDSDPAVSAPIEMDFLGGYAGKVFGDLTVDAGILRYYYPGDYPSAYTSPDTTELYLGFGYGPVSFKYSHAITNLFGVPNSKNSQYYDLSGNFATGVWGLRLDTHVGYQKVKHLDNGSYTDWSVGLSKTFSKGFTVSLAYLDTNADRSVYTNTKGRYLGRSTALLSVSKTF